VSGARDYPSLVGNCQSTVGPLTFAHRGGAGLWPENTLQAFQGAIALGCSHLETDLRMTRDGQIVLMHDARLERTTNGTGELRALSLEELKRLDAGHHFSPGDGAYPARGRGLTVPTLEELVEAAPPGVCFNVEIKERGEPDLPHALWKFIEQHRLEDRIIVAAERQPLLDRFRRWSGGRVATGATRRECLKFWLASRLGAARWVSRPYQALQIPVSAGNVRFLTPRLLESAHRLGIAVHVWTIDDKREMRELLDSGVDGLMTDYPDRLLEVVQGSSGGLVPGGRVPSPEGGARGTGGISEGKMSGSNVERRERGDFH